MDSFLDGIFGWIFDYIISPIINAIGSVLGFVLSTGPSRLIFALLFLNLLGFFLMYKDKKIAKKNGEIKAAFLKENDLNADNLEKTEARKLKRTQYSRVSESTFLLIAFLGGSLGILLGMKKFNHKTKKQKFTIGIPVIIVIHIIFIIWQIITNISAS